MIKEEIKNLLFSLSSPEEAEELLRQGIVPIAVMSGKINPELQNKFNNFYVEDFKTGYRLFDAVDKQVNYLIVDDDKMIVQQTILTDQNPTIKRNDALYITTGRNQYLLSQYRDSFIPQEDKVPKQ